MQPIIAKCGYRCDLCSAFETNLHGQDDKQDFLRALKEYFGVTTMKLEDIKVCKGCVCAEKTPDPDCGVYPCVKEKDLDNCGQCKNFGVCDTLKTRMDVVEEILEKHPDMPPADYERYFKPYLSRELLSSIHRSVNP